MVGIKDSIDLLSVSHSQIKKKLSFYTGKEDICKSS
jgi:hypothetical protein